MDYRSLIKLITIFLIGTIINCALYYVLDLYYPYFPIDKRKNISLLILAATMIWAIYIVISSKNNNNFFLELLFWMLIFLLTIGLYAFRFELTYVSTGYCQCLRHLTLGQLQAVIS